MDLLLIIAHLAAGTGGILIGWSMPRPERLIRAQNPHAKVTRVLVSR